MRILNKLQKDLGLTISESCNSNKSLLYFGLKEDWTTINKKELKGLIDELEEIYDRMRYEQGDSRPD